MTKIQNKIFEYFEPKAHQPLAENLEFKICFGFRISDLEFRILECRKATRLVPQEKSFTPRRASSLTRRRSLRLSSIGEDS